MSSARAGTRVSQNKFVDQYEAEDEYRGRPGVPVDLGRLIHALRRHWRVLPIACAIGALVGLAVASLLIKPSYTARATIMWEPKDSAAPTDRSFLTQVDSIKLPVNLMEVRTRLKSKVKLDDLKEKINWRSRPEHLVGSGHRRSARRAHLAKRSCRVSLPAP